MEAVPPPLIVATLILDDCQVTEAASCAVSPANGKVKVVPSLKVPVAVKDCGVPFGTDGLGGETETAVSTALLTVRLAVP